MVSDKSAIYETVGKLIDRTNLKRYRGIPKGKDAHSTGRREMFINRRKFNS